MSPLSQQVTTRQQFTDAKVFPTQDINNTNKPYYRKGYAIDALKCGNNCFLRGDSVTVVTNVHYSKTVGNTPIIHWRLTQGTTRKSHRTLTVTRYQIIAQLSKE